MIKNKDKTVSNKSGSKRLSPYHFDFGRIIALILRPNFVFNDQRTSIKASFDNEGVQIFPDTISSKICDKIVREYDDFIELCRMKGVRHQYQDDRHYRLTNFHLISAELRYRILQSNAFEFASNFFGKPSSIYTSLYFKHGSQQEAHIDTPFFSTRPINQFVGLWVALEDIHVDSGPLFYLRGSHKILEDEDLLRRYFKNSNGDLPSFFNSLFEVVKEECERVEVVIQKGDALVWHPSLMHGGSLARNLNLTRNSAVFHLAPVGTNVRDDRKFLSNFINFPTYGIKKEHGKFYCRTSLPRFME